MSRKLASIQEILDIQPIAEADAIEVASILGWKVVVKKGEFKVGDHCVYCEIDSIMPERLEFEFLRNKHFRIQTCKLRKQISQGIAFPMSILESVCEPWEIKGYEVGTDVTEKLGVVKYEPNIPALLQATIKGKFPGYVPKTDETRIQASPELLKEFNGKTCYISVKVDGTSASYIIKDDEIDVCSRNLSLKEHENNAYWKMYHKYGIESILKNYDGDIAIQGEVAGPGIQKNPLGLDDVELFVFNVYNINATRHFEYEQLVDFCKSTGLQMVPVVNNNFVFNHTIDELLKIADGNYPSGKLREGIVIRPLTNVYSETLSGRLSVKVINNKYLLKN